MSILANWVSSSLLSVGPLVLLGVLGLLASWFECVESKTEREPQTEKNSGEENQKRAWKQGIRIRGAGYFFLIAIGATTLLNAALAAHADSEQKSQLAQLKKFKELHLEGVRRRNAIQARVAMDAVAQAEVFLLKEREHLFRHATSLTEGAQTNPYVLSGYQEQVGFRWLEGVAESLRSQADSWEAITQELESEFGVEGARLSVLATQLRGIAESVRLFVIERRREGEEHYDVRFVLEVFDRITSVVDHLRYATDRVASEAYEQAALAEIVVSDSQVADKSDKARK